MKELEKVMSWLEGLAQDDWHSFHSDSEVSNIAKAALALLKEQEAKTGHWFIDEHDFLTCSCCGKSYYTGCYSMKEAKANLEKGKVYRYCPYCGSKMEGR